MKPVILLSGPPGAGKTTVAAELVKISPEPIACIEGDKFWSFFAKGWEDMVKGVNFKTAMRSMISAAVPFAINGYETIVDFSIPPWYLEAACKITSSRKVPMHYVVIRPDRDICAGRAAKRAEGAMKDYGYYDDLYTSFDSVQKYTIYDNESDAATIAVHIREGLDEGIFSINWPA